MNFDHRQKQQQDLIAGILSHGELVLTEAQKELKFAVGVSNMSLWTPSLVALLEVCGRIKAGTIKKWREEQMAMAVKEFNKK
jgi:hypothetical protein